MDVSKTLSSSSGLAISEYVDKREMTGEPKDKVKARVL